MSRSSTSLITGEQMGMIRPVLPPPWWEEDILSFFSKKTSFFVNLLPALNLTKDLRLSFFLINVCDCFVHIFNRLRFVDHESDAWGKLFAAWKGGWEPEVDRLLVGKHHCHEHLDVWSKLWRFCAWVQVADVGCWFLRFVQSERSDWTPVLIDLKVLTSHVELAAPWVFPYESCSRSERWY